MKSTVQELWLHFFHIYMCTNHLSMKCNQEIRSVCMETKRREQALSSIHHAWTDTWVSIFFSKYCRPLLRNIFVAMEKKIIWVGGLNNKLFHAIVLTLFSCLFSVLFSLQGVTVTFFTLVLVSITIVQNYTGNYEVVAVVLLWVCSMSNNANGDKLVICFRHI